MKKHFIIFLDLSLVYLYMSLIIFQLLFLCRPMVWCCHSAVIRCAGEIQGTIFAYSPHPKPFDPNLQSIFATTHSS